MLTQVLDFEFDWPLRRNAIGNGKWDGT